MSGKRESKSKRKYCIKKSTFREAFGTSIIENSPKIKNHYNKEVEINDELKNNIILNLECKENNCIINKYPEKNLNQDVKYEPRENNTNIISVHSKFNQIILEGDKILIKKESPESKQYYENHFSNIREIFGDGNFLYHAISYHLTDS